MDFRTFVRDDVLTCRSQSTYTPQLARYLAHFRRDNLLVLVYEEIFRDTQRALDTCARHLNVATGFTPSSVRFLGPRPDGTFMRIGSFARRTGR